MGMTCSSVSAQSARGTMNIARSTYLPISILGAAEESFD